MDQALLRAYFATVYEFSTPSGPLRVSLDGENTVDPKTLPELISKKFALLTAYNPRSMLLPRKVNDGRHIVMRDLLILGCYRVEPCMASEGEPEGVWREPTWYVHGMDRDEAVAFGRVFRQNGIVTADKGKPELIITDPTADDVGKTYPANFRIRT